MSNKHYNTEEIHLQSRSIGQQRCYHLEEFDLGNTSIMKAVTASDPKLH